jgi:hypothetical protein
MKLEHGSFLSIDPKAGNYEQYIPKKISRSVLPGGRGDGHFPEMWPVKNCLGREKLVVVKVAVSDLEVP